MNTNSDPAAPEDAARASSERGGWARARRLPPAAAFAITFAILALGGVTLLLVPAVEAAVVAPLTRSLVLICATLMNLFGAEVTASGDLLAFAGTSAAVSVQNGCNAIEVCVLLAAAILAWPAKAGAKLIGVIACVASVQAINLARIISLLFLVRYSPDLFEFFHLYVWEAMILLEAVLVFAFWVRRQDGATIVAQPAE